MKMAVGHAAAVALAVLGRAAHAKRSTRVADDWLGEQDGQFLSAWSGAGLDWQPAAYSDEDEHGAEAGDVVRGGVPGTRVELWPKAWAKKLRPEAAFIASGTSGEVGVATLVCDGSPVAVKKLRGTRKDVGREADMMKAFGSCPNVVTYFDHRRGEDDSEDAIAWPSFSAAGTYYIMMEYVAGGNLSPIIDGRTKVALHEKLSLFYDTLNAVKEMHDMNVVHRDLKPQNILISGECGGTVPCVAKVSDFGLACQTHGDPLFDGVPRCSSVAGPPMYLAPETYATGAIHTKNDVWALGLLLYAIKFQRFPAGIQEPVLTMSSSIFPMEDLAEIIKAFDIRLDARFRRLMKGDVVKNLLRGMLARRPSDRLSAEAAMDMASDFAGHAGHDSVATLPECWFTGKDVRTFTAERVPMNVIVLVSSYLFSKKMVDQSTGVVVDPRDKLQYLRVRNYFPTSLRRGDRILQVNGVPFPTLARNPNAPICDAGLLGCSLIIRYEKA